MRAFSVACLIVVLAARAEAQRVEYMHVAVPGYQRVVKLDTAVIWTRVDTPAPETYHALRLALEELKIPVVLADSAHFFIYNALDPSKIASSCLLVFLLTRRFELPICVPLDDGGDEPWRSGPESLAFSSTSE